MTEKNEQRKYDYSILNRIYYEMLGKGFDIDKITDKFGKPVEPLIEPLVLALNYRGYPTYQSCQGHSPGEWKERLKERIDSGRYKLYRETEHSIIFKERIPYVLLRFKKEFRDSPWVSLEDPGQRITDLAKIVKAHNQLGGVNWKLTRFNRRIYDLTAVPTDYLIKMQEDIPRLAYEIAIN